MDEAGLAREHDGSGDALRGEESTALRYEELLDRIATAVADQQDLEELADLEARSNRGRLQSLENKAAESLSSIPDDEPLPGDLRNRVLDAARGSGRASAGKRWPARVSKHLILAAVVALVALFVSSTQLRDRAGEGLLARLPVDAARARLLTVSSDVGQWPCAGDDGRVAGDVVWDNERQEGYLRLRGVDANDPARSQYQLWIFDEARDERYPVQAGVFDVPPGHSEVVVPIRSALPIRQPNAFAVTEEPAGGVVVPDGGRVVALARTRGQ